MNLPAGEPKDGDFVAYLDEIERQQMAHLPSHALAALAVADQLERARSAPAIPGLAAGVSAAHIGRIILFVIGLFLLLLGLVGHGGMIAVAIGAFLLWRAARSLSSELRDTRHDVRERLAQALDAENPKP